MPESLHSLSEEERRRAITYELEGFGSLGLIADTMRSHTPQDQAQVEEWQTIWLLRYRSLLWAYGYTQEQRRTIHTRLEQLHAAGRYPLEFQVYSS